MLLPVSAGVMAVRQDRRVSHLLMAVDDTGLEALTGLGRLMPADPGGTAPEPGPDAIRISVGKGPEPGRRSDLHVCIVAKRAGRSRHRGARLRVSAAAELPAVLDDLIALTEQGLVAVSPEELGWMLKTVPRAVGAYVSVPLESHRRLDELQFSTTHLEAVVASVRIPDLGPGDELGFEAVNQIQLAFETSHHILINAVPARSRTAHIGLFVWP